MSQPRRITFQNHQNPQSGFDLVPLKEVPKRAGLDHSPFNLHHVGFYIIMFVTKGQGKHTIDFHDFSCEAGTILTIRRDQLHKFSPESGLEGTLLLFTDDFLSSYLEQLEEQKSLQLFNELLGSPQIQLGTEDRDCVLQLTDRIKQEYLSINDAYSMAIIRSELHILINKLYRIKSTTDNQTFNRKYLDRFIEFQQLVEAGITESKRVSDYAHKMALSTKSLNNISQSIVHKSAKAFIDEIGIKQIKRFLANTNLSVKEIAYASGFEESTNFYKYFKRHTNMTPEQFRNQH
ncbi:MAG: helix-turn-helix transcriptional regulator [Bacteroidota bacterium]